jgi:hypothetical protein
MSRNGSAGDEYESDDEDTQKWDDCNEDSQEPQWHRFCLTIGETANSLSVRVNDYRGDWLCWDRLRYTWICEGDGAFVGFEVADDIRDNSDSNQNSPVKDVR